MCRRFIIKSLKTNFLILGITLLIIQGVVFAYTKVNVTYKTVGNTTTYYANGKVIGTYKIKMMSNGFVETEACYGDFCHYDVMTSLMAKNYIYTLKDIIKASYENKIWFAQQAQQEKQKEQIKQANKSIIVKQVVITTSNGEKISFQEDKNGDDYLVINGQRVEVIGRKLATDKNMYDYDPYPENAQLENVIAKAEQEDAYLSKKRSYEEIIYSSPLLGDLFKLVYKLRVEYGVSYEDAQKLMTFGINNKHYKPSDLLLPSEKQAIKYQKLHKETTDKLKNVTFPKL